MQQLLTDLQAAVDQLPSTAYAAEADPLREYLQSIHAGRRRGMQAIGDILPIVLAKLGASDIQSAACEVNAPHANGTRRPETTGDQDPD